MEGTVSILMPAKNEEQNIRAAVESLLNQDYRKIIQFTVVDDESTDSTFQILQQLQKQYPKQLTIVRKKHMGLGSMAEAYNIGLREAKGEYILTAEADAVYESFFVSSVIKKIASDSEIACVAPQFFFPGKGIWIEAANLFRRARVFLGNPPHGGKFYKRKAVIEVGGFNENIYVDDSPVAKELRKKGYKVIWEGERPLWWHSVSGQLDSNFSFIRKSFKDGLRAVQADIKYPARAINQGNFWLLFFLFSALSPLNQLFLIPAVFMLGLCAFWNFRYLYGALHYSKNPILLAAMLSFVVLSGIATSVGRIFGFGRLLLKF